MVHRFHRCRVWPQQAGDLLGSAIAEVAQQGVDAQHGEPRDQPMERVAPPKETTQEVKSGWFTDFFVILYTNIDG